MFKLTETNDIGTEHEEFIDVETLGEAKDYLAEEYLAYNCDRWEEKTDSDGSIYWKLSFELDGNFGVGILEEIK